MAKELVPSFEGELPQGWAIGTIGDLISPDGVFIDGDWVESKDQDPNGDVRLIQLADVADGYYKDKSARFLTKEKALKLNCTFLEKGDVLIARMPDPLGRACIFPGDKKESVTVVDVCVVRTGTEDANHKWLMYWINSPRFRNTISSLQSGTTRKRISRGNLATISLPVPPPEQQKRIVAKIEELFSHIDAGIEALKKAKQLLKQYRQSVLKAAVTGELTKEWREQNNLSQGSWKCSKIGEVAKVETGKTPRRSSKEFWENGTIPWLTSSATNEAFAHHADQFVTKAAVEGGLKLFEPGTLLLAMYGEGKTRGQVTEITFQATCNQACAAIIVDENKVSRAFVRLCLYENYEDTRKAASGGNQPNLNLSKVREILLPLPPMVEQDEIVVRVDQKFEAIERLEKDIGTQLLKLEKNKQSILATVFLGKLNYL